MFYRWRHMSLPARIVAGLLMLGAGALGTHLVKQSKDCNCVEQQQVHQTRAGQNAAAVALLRWADLGGRKGWTGGAKPAYEGRPNRIGVSVCTLLGVDGRRVSVRGLDAIDGTPVLDIKPYMHQFGPRGDVRQPRWADEIMADYF